MVSIEAHPRTPSIKPVNPQIQPSGSSPGRPRRTRGPAVVLLHTSHCHSQATGPRQPHPVPHPQRLAPPISSSGADADLNTDDVESEMVRGEGLPWYHVSATEVHEVVQLEQTDVDCVQGTLDNDDGSLVDPSGVSTASVEQSDVEEEEQRGRVSVSCEASRDNVDGSLCVQASETGSRERRGEPEETHRRRSWGDRRTSDPTEVAGGEGEVDELDNLLTSLSSPQSNADPMWYHCRSGSEEPPSASSSHEGSPAPTLTPGYPGGLATPTLSPWGPPPEGVGAMVVFPSHTQPHQRKSSSRSVPPLSPTSLLSSGSSSQHSGQGQPPPPRYILYSIGQQWHPTQWVEVKTLSPSLSPILPHTHTHSVTASLFLSRGAWLPANPRARQTDTPPTRITIAMDPWPSTAITQPPSTADRAIS